MQPPRCSWASRQASTGEVEFVAQPPTFRCGDDEPAPTQTRQVVRDVLAGLAELNGQLGRVAPATG